jgi:maltooligosyltrehalose synthase
VWQDTRVKLPEVNDTRSPWPSSFREVLTGATVQAREDEGAMWLDAADILSRFPVALLVPAS